MKARAKSLKKKLNAAEAKKNKSAILKVTRSNESKTVPKTANCWREEGTKTINAKTRKNSPAAISKI